MNVKKRLAGGVLDLMTVSYTYSVMGVFSDEPSKKSLISALNEIVMSVYRDGEPVSESDILDSWMSKDIELGNPISSKMTFSREQCAAISQRKWTELFDMISKSGPNEWDSSFY